MWIENLTVRNFERESLNGAGGNEIWWNGGAETGKIGAHGWYGRYLTAYDTGLNGGYGIFTDNETEGEWEDIYASGFNDSGIYIGACQECKARIERRDDGIQRARLLGLELRRQPDHRKLGVPTTTRRASRRTPKTRVTGRRRRTAHANTPSRCTNTSARKANATGGASCPNSHRLNSRTARSSVTTS